MSTTRPAATTCTVLSLLSLGALAPAAVFAQAATDCSAAFTPIPAIQGSESTAQITGSVITQGVVVGDFEGPSPALRGFYLQDATGDGDPATSDGIFVFNGNNNTVALGNLVRVAATAGEFQGQTQLSTVSSIVACASGVDVAPVDIALPFASADLPERYEGMLVRLPQTLYVTEHFQLGRFGQVVLSSSDRLRQPTDVVEPGAPAVALQSANALNRLILDDALNSQNPDPILFARGGLPLSASNTLRGGDHVTGLVGVMTFTWAGNAASGNAYRVRPVGALGGGIPTFAAANPRPAQAPDVGGTMRVAGFNVLNYFLTLDVGTTRACGPLNFKQECRGAEDVTELQRQRDKLVPALLKLNADIIGLIELENTENAAGQVVDPLADLVARMNVAAGVGTYDYVDTGIVGTDTIRVGLIYDASVAKPHGDFAVLDGSVDPRFESTRNRPVLAQSFEQLSNGTRLTVAVTHFKSKSAPVASDPAFVCLDGNPANDVPDCDQRDGQGYFNRSRTLAAEALGDWLASDPTGSGDPDVLIVGDLNAYSKEDPVRALQQAGYSNLVPRFSGAGVYSYVFDGQWGSLDHALASASLVLQVVDAADYHINADEPNVLDYNTNFKSAGHVTSLYAADEFRTSDHDPLLVGLAQDEVPPQLALTASPAVLWPPNHQYVKVAVDAVAVDNTDGDPSIKFVGAVSNEADDGIGDGSNTNDIVRLDDRNFWLRAERSGAGSGRIYTLTYLATDSAGNSSERSVEVVVPRNR